MQLDLIYFEMVILALNLVLFDWKAFYALGTTLDTERGKTN